MTIFPTYQSTTVTDFGADATAHAANMPATVNPGDLLLAIAAFDMGAGTTITTPSGWTLLGAQEGSTLIASSFYGKVAVGDEDSATVDFVTSDAQRGSVHVFRVSGWAGALDAIRLSSSSAGAASRDRLSIGTVARDILWIAAQIKSSATAWGATQPSGYSNVSKTNASEDTTVSASIASASRTNSAFEELITAWWNTTGLDLIIAVPPVGAAYTIRPRSLIGV